VSQGKLSQDEDAELRRLHMLRGFGMVAELVSSRYDALRGRDRRRSVREPEDDQVAVPVVKTVWADSVRTPAPREPSGAQRGVSDAREVFGNAPEPRRGLGIFRR
jgi:hypothetical protein